MNPYLKVEGHSDLYRDPKTGAIINTNKSEFEVYSKAQKLRMTDKQRINTLENDISQIQSELTDIKLLLQKLLEK